MARGDIIVFDQFLLDLMLKVHDLNAADTLRIGFIGNAVTPSVSTADPHWGGTGTTNLATDAKSGGSFPATPTALTSVTATLNSGTPKLDAADPSAFSKNASNPTDIYWAIIYNDTSTNKKAICAYDMGGPVDGTAGDVTVTFNASGIATLNQA